MSEPVVVAVPVSSDTHLLNGNTSMSACPHKQKKRCFDMNEIRKRNKKTTTNNDSSCHECARLKLKVARPAEWMCVACGFYGCGEGDEHALAHFKAARTGAEHPIFYSPNNNTFRCFSCNMDLDPNEENSRVKVFQDEYNSYVKQKAKATGGEPKATVDVVVEVDDLQKAKGEQQLVVKKEKKANGTTSDLEAGSGKQGRKDKKDFLLVKGLANLGNTCFFNSIMQCMSHTHLVARYMELVAVKEVVNIKSEKVHIADKIIKVPSVSLTLEPFSGSLNEHLGRFIREYRQGSSHTVQPAALFSEIAKKAQRFRGFAQQDAHELLRYLLDGVRTEELNRYKEAIQTYLKIPKGVNPKSIDGELVVMAKGMLKGCGRPLVDAIFGGTLLQTVKCSQCGYLSRTFEEFLDISLPIPCTSSTSKFVFNGASRIHKSASATLSKHQKKKEKANARKRSRRKSLGESGKSPKEESEVDDDLEEVASQGVASVDGDDFDEQLPEEELIEKVGHLDVDGDPDECLLLLGEEPHEESARTIASCLRAFTTAETLSGQNAYECEKCCLPGNKKLRNGLVRKSVDAEKRYLIYEPPAVLTLHLKRFEQTHSMNGRVSTRKVGGQVSFPSVLDISPFCTRIAKRVSGGSRRVLYSLYGVVSHSGQLSSGHYIAYVRNRRPSPVTEKFFYEAANMPEKAAACDNGPSFHGSEDELSVTPGEWYYASDSSVCATSESRVLAAEAYVLFYERIL